MDSIQVGDIITYPGRLGSGSVIRVVSGDHTVERGDVYVKADSGYWFMPGVVCYQSNVGNGRAQYEVLALPLD